MISFRNYIQETLLEYIRKEREKTDAEKAIEDSGRYVMQFVDLHNKMEREEGRDFINNLMYDQGALMALTNHFLGSRYAHLPEFQHLGSEKKKAENRNYFLNRFPHLHHAFEYEFK